MRMWQIVEIEDWSRHKFFAEAINHLLLSPLCEIKNNFYIELDRYLFQTEIKMQETECSILNKDLVKDRYGSSMNLWRYPIYTRVPDLIKAWEYYNIVKKGEIFDLNIIDIKLYDPEFVSDDIDWKPYKKLIVKYMDGINHYSNAYGGKFQDHNDYSPKQAQDFASNGGMVIFAFLRKFFNTKNIDQQHPIIVIQTGSKAIDQFSILEFLYPDDVRILDKLKVENDSIKIYESFFYEKINNFLKYGYIDPLKLKKCLLDLSDATSVDDYKNIFFSPLSSEEDSKPWRLISLVPWVCHKILLSESSEEKKSAINNLESLLANYTLTEDLSFFFNGPNNNLISMLIHGGQFDAQTLEGIGDFDANFNDLVVERMPKFLKKIYNTKKSESKNLTFLIDFCNMLNDFLNLSKDWDSRNFRNYRMDYLSHPENAENILSKLDYFKINILRPSRNPVKSIIKQLEPHNERIEIISPDSLIFRNINDILSSQDNNFKAIYMPWNKLKGFIDIIFQGNDDKCEMNLTYSYEQKFLQLFLHFPQTTQEHDIDLISTGDFGIAIESLKNWCQIFFSSQSTRRNLHLKKETGSYTLEQEILGNQYQINIPCHTL